MIKGTERGATDTTRTATGGAIHGITIITSTVCFIPIANEFPCPRCCTERFSRRSDGKNGACLPMAAVLHGRGGEDRNSIPLI